MIIPTPESRNPRLSPDEILAALGVVQDSSDPAARYTIIQGHSGPRWLLPQRGGLTGTILKEWRPYGAPARAYWMGVRAAARLGLAAFLPRTGRAPAPADTGTQFLNSIGLNESGGLPAILVGNTVATRKLLVFLEVGDDRRRVVAKVPLTPMARLSIETEAAALRRLDRRHRAPRLLHFSAEKGAAVQEYLAGKLGSRRCKPRYIQMLLEFILPDAKIALRERGARLAARLHASDHYRHHAGTIDPALRYLDCDAQVDSALVHGDFAPWNIRELPDGACTLIDWELARWDGIAFFDLCHFYYMQCLLFSRETLFYEPMLAEGAWRDYCRPLGMAPALLPRLSAAFLLEMMAGYWETEDPIAAFGLHQMELFLSRVALPKD